MKLHKPQTAIYICGPDTPPGLREGAVSWRDFKKSFISLACRFRWYQPVEFVCRDLNELPRPGLLFPLLYIIGRGTFAICDLRGRKQIPGLRGTCFAIILLFMESFQKKRVIKQAQDLFFQLAQTERVVPTIKNTEGRVSFVRGDISHAIGGAESHTRGILNGLIVHGRETEAHLCYRPDLISSHVALHVQACPNTFLNEPEVRQIQYNMILSKHLLERWKEKRPALVYQRHGAYSFAGFRGAQELQIPFVLEYNGSEVWITDNWGEPLKYRKLAVQIEKTILEKAELIVSISDVLTQQLVDRGVDLDKIVTVPNGVDTSVFHPGVDASSFKEKYELDQGPVFGFIGSFGTWHGTKLLPEIFEKYCMMAEALELPPATLVLYGDGSERTACERDASARTFGKNKMIFTGRVEAHEAPSALAACDVLLSPHVSNKDGSAFFGSPTKLFEYMASGRAIVASDLDQIGQILKNDVHALTVPAGDTTAFAEAMLKLVQDHALSEKLAKNARRLACEHYSWESHVAQILDAFNGRVAL
ncbi:glycosyltransferase family 4 protein [Terasakiella sp.]|uniref:glycosyltransferase family 4 protein n=1 Tax=Terasakiella sp. TaxID=2034861 RepID=UPI003AA99944